MKKIRLLAVILILIPFALSAQDDKEQEAIKKVIQTAYVDGLQNKGSVCRH